MKVISDGSVILRERGNGRIDKSVYVGGGGEIIWYVNCKRDSVIQRMIVCIKKKKVWMLGKQRQTGITTGMGQ